MIRARGGRGPGRLGGRGPGARVGGSWARVGGSCECGAGPELFWKVELERKLADPDELLHSRTPRNLMTAYDCPGIILMKHQR